VVDQKEKGVKRINVVRFVGNLPMPSLSDNPRAEQVLEGPVGLPGLPLPPTDASPGLWSRVVLLDDNPSGGS